MKPIVKLTLSKPSAIIYAEDAYSHRLERTRHAYYDTMTSKAMTNSKCTFEIDCPHGAMTIFVLDDLSVLIKTLGTSECGTTSFEAFYSIEDFYARGQPRDVVHAVRVALKQYAI